METPGLEILKAHITDYLEKAEIRNEGQIADAQTMGRSLQSRYKIKSPEALALGKFIKTLDTVRKRRFPKVIKQQLSELPEDIEDET